MKSILETGLTDEQFSALANKTRRDILAIIYEVSTSLRNIAEQLGDNIVYVKRHLRILQHIFYYIAAAKNQPVPEGLEELLIPEATWYVASDDPYRPATLEDLFRGLYL